MQVLYGMASVKLIPSESSVYKMNPLYPSNAGFSHPCQSEIKRLEGTSEDALMYRNKTKYCSLEHRPDNADCLFVVKSLVLSNFSMIYTLEFPRVNMAEFYPCTRQRQAGMSPFVPRASRSICHICQELFA